MNTWKNIDLELPEHKKEVLCKRGRRKFIAILVGEKELEADTDYDFDEETVYDEERDVFYCVPGWYEQSMEHDDFSYWRVEPPTHWTALPEEDL